MSTNDVMQDDEYENEPEAVEEATTDTEEVEESEPVAGEDSEAEEGEDEYEVVERKPEPSPEAKKQNAAFAKQRIEAKEAKRRAQEAEEQLRQIEQGYIPESLKEKLSVQPSLPEQPKWEDYFSDSALEKYGYDQSRAQAAFNAAQSQWLFDAQNARSTSQVQETQKRQQFIEQERKRIQAVQKVAKAAESLNLETFDDSAGKLDKMIPGSVDYIAGFFGADSREAAAVINFLGRNPERAREINSLSAPEALNELAKLGYRELLIQKKKRVVPDADSGLEGGAPAPVNTTAWKKELSKLIESDTAEYRKRKAEIERQIGRRIENHELL